jgi:hypothetical protein
MCESPERCKLDAANVHYYGSQGGIEGCFPPTSPTHRTRRRSRQSVPRNSVRPNAIQSDDALSLLVRFSNSGLRRAARMSAGSWAPTRHSAMPIGLVVSQRRVQRSHVFLALASQDADAGAVVGVAKLIIGIRRVGHFKQRTMGWFLILDAFHFGSSRVAGPLAGRSASKLAGYTENFGTDPVARFRTSCSKRWIETGGAFRTFCRG